MIVQHNDFNIKKLRTVIALPLTTNLLLAEAADISEATIKSVELCLNWPSEKTIAQIANALEIDIAKLFLPLADSLESYNQTEIKKAIAENLKLYVNSVLEEIVS